jgi:plasmid stability protein
MSDLTIHAIDDDTNDRLRIEAERNGRSVEEEARRILAAALTARSHPSTSAGLAIAAIVDLPHRGGVREPPRFDDWRDEDE